MKQTILAILLATAFSAQAGQPQHNQNPSSTVAAVAGAVANNQTTIKTTTTAVGVGQGGNGQGGDAATGPVTNTFEGSDIPRNYTAPPAIAPNVTNVHPCPVIVQGSFGFSIFLASISKTTTPELIPICLALIQDNKALVHALACNESPHYRKTADQLHEADAAQPACPAVK